MQFCSFCGVQSYDLQRCNRCKAEFYCSRICQRNHWKDGHKTECREVSIDEIKDVRECSFCGVRSSALLRCSRCKGKYYCSRDCQRHHWKDGHKRECSESGMHESSPPVLRCTSCKKSSEQLKRCTGCLQVSYCSRECQIQDWRLKHKDECSRIHKEEDGSKEVTKDDQKDSVCQEEKTINEEENSHKSLQVCTVCGKQGTMKVCQRCQIQKYCSVECQKADWKKHKSNCTKEKQPKWSEKGSDVPLPICANCRSQSAVLRCSGCRVVYYCSKDCQTSDWNKHKASCRAYRSQTRIRETLTVAECSLMGLVTPEEHRGRNPNDTKKQSDIQNFFTTFSCRRCKSAAGNCKVTCPECKSVMYCSEVCRELDKSGHRKTCTPLYFPPSEISISSCFGENADGTFRGAMSGSPSHAKLPLPRDPLFVEDGADLKWIVERTIQSRSKAIKEITQKYPYHTLITRLREIPMEEKTVFSSNISTHPYVFLSYIRRFHNYRGRHNVYLQDSERREIYVSFYLPNDDPTPYFQWSDLVPGKFVAILFPCIHFFQDFSVGLRVDKAKNVYCFDVKD